MCEWPCALVMYVSLAVKVCRVRGVGSCFLGEWIGFANENGRIVLRFFSSFPCTAMRSKVRGYWNGSAVFADSSRWESQGIASDVSHVILKSGFKVFFQTRRRSGWLLVLSRNVLRMLETIVYIGWKVSSKSFSRQVCYFFHHCHTFFTFLLIC